MGNKEAGIPARHGGGCCGVLQTIKTDKDLAGQLYQEAFKKLNQGALNSEVIGAWIHFQ